jgi:hypothetical protein
MAWWAWVSRATRGWGETERRRNGEAERQSECGGQNFGLRIADFGLREKQGIQERVEE